MMFSRLIQYSRRLPASFLVFLLTFVVYRVAAGGMFVEQSLAPHYIHLANSFLHGRLDLMVTDNLYDLLVVNGKAYVSSPPMPAILLMPIVAIFSETFSDVLFSVILGAVNVTLVHRIFRQRWLTLFFALGTTHFHFGSLGTMWLQAQLVAIFFSLLALNEMGVGQSTPKSTVCWGLVGIYWACAVLSRPTLAFGAIFLALWLWFEQLPAKRWSSLLALSLPIGGAVLVYGLYNWARFDNPTDFGYIYLQGSDNIPPVIQNFGTFHWRFAPCNGFVSLLMPVQIAGKVPDITYRLCGYLLQGANLSDTSAFMVPNGIGMSIFLVSPAFLLLAWARATDKRTIAAWVGLLATMLPIWLLHNTGSLQFGYRYWLDASPMWLYLLASVFAHFLETNKGKSIWVKALVVTSIGLHLWGFLWLYQKFVGMGWWLAWTAR